MLQNDSEDGPIGPSEYRFKRLWEQCLTFFRVSAHSDDGFTPGSLRAGCATALYLDGVPLDDIRWLLRHTSQKQLESYIQELPLAMNRVRHAAAAPQVEAHAALFDVALKAAILGDCLRCAQRSVYAQLDFFRFCSFIFSLDSS